VARMPVDDALRLERIAVVALLEQPAAQQVFPAADARALVVVPETEPRGDPDIAVAAADQVVDAVAGIAKVAVPDAAATGLALARQQQRRRQPIAVVVVAQLRFGLPDHAAPAGIIGESRLPQRSRVFQFVEAGA